MSCTVTELYGHDDDLFGIGLRSWMRNRELHPTTASFGALDGVRRRQSRKTRDLGKSVLNSQILATYVWTLSRVRRAITTVIT